MSKKKSNSVDENHASRPRHKNDYKYWIDVLYPDQKMIDRWRDKKIEGRCWVSGVEQLGGPNILIDHVYDEKTFKFAQRIANLLNMADNFSDDDLDSGRCTIIRSGPVPGRK